MIRRLTPCRPTYYWILFWFTGWTSISWSYSSVFLPNSSAESHNRFFVVEAASAVPIFFFFSSLFHPASFTSKKNREQIQKYGVFVVPAEFHWPKRRPSSRCWPFIFKLKICLKKIQIKLDKTQKLKNEIKKIKKQKKPHVAYRRIATFRTHRGWQRTRGHPIKFHVESIPIPHDQWRAPKTLH